MALPTKNEIQEHRYSFNGSPFCNINAKSSISTVEHEYSFFGSPWVVPLSPSLKVISIMWTNIKKIGGIIISQIKKIGGVSP